MKITMIPRWYRREVYTHERGRAGRRTYPGRAGGPGTPGGGRGGEHSNLSRCWLVLGRWQADSSDGQAVEHQDRSAHAGLVSHAQAGQGDGRGGGAGGAEWWAIHG